MPSCRSSGCWNRRTPAGACRMASGLIDHAQGARHAGRRARRRGRGRSRSPNFRRQRLDLLNGQASGDGVMWPGDLIRALSDAVPAETIVTTDVGSHKYLFGQFWPSRHPETFWMSNGLSGMAYGLSAAIGAKLARPGCAGARRGRRRRVLDERAGARDRRARRRAVCDDRARRRQLFVDQARAGEPQARAVPHGFRPDRQREDGRILRCAGPAHVQPRRTGRGRAARRRGREEPGRRPCRFTTPTIESYSKAACRTFSIR